MDPILETDPFSLSLVHASIVELWVHPEREAGIKLIAPGLSKQYVPVGVWLDIRFTPLAGWKIAIRTNLWPELIQKIRIRSLPDADWDDVMKIWRNRHPENDGPFSVYTIETDEGTIEFLAQDASREVIDVVQRVIPEN